MIEINNLTACKVDEKFLKKTANIVLKGEKEKQDLSVAIVGPGKIKELNRRYRRKNKATDVLSFSDKDLKEVIVCYQEVKKNAKKYGSTFKKELTRVLIHGILHTLGYEHKNMEKKQEKYISLCQNLKL